MLPTHSIKKIYILSIILFQISLLSFSQTLPINFEHITTKEGLSYNSVFSIGQDKYGFLWFGTENGLNRYDGYEFKLFVYNPNDSTSISNNKVWDIVKDKNGLMWFATEEGLCCYDYDTESFIRYNYDSSNTNTLGYKMVRSLYVDSLNNLWIGTYGGGIDYFNQKNKKFEHFKHSLNNRSISDNTVSDIYEDSFSNLWIASDGGLNLLEKETGTFKSYYHDEENKKSLSHDHVICVREDRRGNLWLGTWGGGLNRLDSGYNHKLENNKLEFKHYLDNTIIQDIIEDKTGNLWVASRGGGIYLYDWDKDRFIQHAYDIDLPNSLNNNIIVDLFEDVSGIIWAGTLGGGINKYERKKFELYQSNSDFKNINSLLVEPNKKGDIVWIGSQTKGLIRWKIDVDSIKYYLKAPVSQGKEFIRVIQKDTSNMIWVGTDNGLGLLDKNINSINYYSTEKLSSIEIYALYIDCYNYLWIGTFKGGLNRLNLNNPKNFNTETAVFEKSNSPALRSIDDQTIRTIYEDSDSILWVGTERGGLNKFNRDSNIFIPYKNILSDTNSLSDNYVRCIFEDCNKNLWIGTANGLNKLPKDKKNDPVFIRYTVKNGLANNSIRGIQEDDKGNLWVSTDFGITKLNPFTNEVKIFSTQDGLQGEGFTDNVCGKGYSGVLYFGGKNGLNIFHPDSIKINIFPPQIIITKLKIGNQLIPIGEMQNGHMILSKSITETENIRLKWNQRNLTFEFAALHYSSPENNKYTYKLEGFDKTWSDISTVRTATYTNLNPGGYTFKIQGSNSDGEWGKKKSIKINISAPLWKLWWFYPILIILFISLTIYFIYHNRKRKAELIFIRDTGEKLTNNIQLDEKTIMDLIRDTVRNLLKTNNLYVTLYDVQNKTYRYDYLIKDGKPINKEDKILSPHTIDKIEKSEEIFSTKKHILIRTLKKHKKWYKVRGNKDIPEPLAKSYIGIPIKLKNNIIGVISSFDFEKNFKYNKQHVRIISVFANYAAIALDNSRLLQESNNRIKLLELAVDIGKDISAQLSKKEMLSTLINQVKEHLGCNHCSIFYPNKNKDVLIRYQITDGSQTVNSKNIISFNVDESVVGWAYKEGKSKLCNNVYDIPEYFKRTNEPKGTYRSMLVVPIKSGNFTVAVICADQDEFEYFTLSDKYFLEVLAQQVGNSIDRINGLDELQKIGNQILNLEKTENIDSLLSKILLGAIKLTDTTTGIIYLISEDGQTVIERYPKNNPDHPEPRLDNKNGLTRQIIDTHNCISIDDTDKNPNTNQGLIGKYKSIIGIPLKFEEKVIGVFYLYNKTERIFNKTDISILQTLAGQATIAIVNAKLYEKQYENKKTIERNLIVAKMFSHRMGSRIMRSVQICDNLIQNDVNSNTKDNLQKNIKYLKSSFISTSILTEFLLGYKTNFIEYFEKFDIIKLLKEIKEDIEFDEINRWIQTKDDLKNWKCIINIKFEFTSFEIVGISTFIRTAIDSFVANSVEALRKTNRSGEVIIEVSKDIENLILRINSNGPPVKPKLHYEFLKNVINHIGDMDSLIDIEPPVETEESIGIHRRLGLKIATFIIKFIHNGLIKLESQENEAPCFLILLPINKKNKIVT